MFTLWVQLQLIKLDEVHYISQSPRNITYMPRISGECPKSRFWFLTIVIVGFPTGNYPFFSMAFLWLSSCVRLTRDLAAFPLRQSLQAMYVRSEFWSQFESHLGRRGPCQLASSFLSARDCSFKFCRENKKPIAACMLEVRDEGTISLQ